MYILEGINSEGRIVSHLFGRLKGRTISESAESAAQYHGVSGYYSWFLV